MPGVTGSSPVSSTTFGAGLTRHPAPSLFFRAQMLPGTSTRGASGSGCSSSSNEARSRLQAGENVDKDSSLDGRAWEVFKDTGTRGVVVVKCSAIRLPRRICPPAMRRVSWPSRTSSTRDRRGLAGELRERHSRPRRHRCAEDVCVVTAGQDPGRDREGGLRLVSAVFGKSALPRSLPSAMMTAWDAKGCLDWRVRP